MKSIILAALVITCALSAGCGSSSAPASSSPAPAASSAAAVHPISKESEQLYRKAVTAYGKGDHLNALELANKALEKDCENYKALSLKGIIQAFDVSPEEGIKTIEKSIAINPAYVQADFDMAMAQKLGKHYDESIRYFQKVLDKDPKNTWSWYGIATNYADKRDKAKALEHLKKAVDLDPQNVKPQAAAQDHFQWLHGDPDFQNLVK
jgi:tetratricopeptide (TPR) repeat protein